MLLLKDHDVALRLVNVSKVFRREKRRSWRRLWPGNGPSLASAVNALDGVTLEVRRHEIFGILGPNGSGKSTLVRVVSTLLLPDAGRAEVFGFDVVREEKAVKRLINRVSVEAAFFKKLSAVENLMFGARLYGLSGTEARARIVAVLRRLGLEEEAAYQPVENLSRGMQQKVAIARAFLTRPILLLLDEPTTGLDPRSRREVQAFVRELRNEHDATIVLTTHDMHEAEQLCDRVAVIDRGRIVALGTPEALKARVASEGLPEPTLEDVFLALTGRHLTDSHHDQEVIA